MIENKMGMSIMERDDDGGADEDERAAPVVNALNSCGATALCLDLIADGIDENLQLEAVKLGVGLLFKEGGAFEVQGLISSKHLSQLRIKIKLIAKRFEKLQDMSKLSIYLLLESIKLFKKDKLWRWSSQKMGQKTRNLDELLLENFSKLFLESFRQIKVVNAMNRKSCTILHGWRKFKK